MSRYEVRRRIWAWDPVDRRRRTESVLTGVEDTVILGPASAALWHGVVFAVETVAMVLLTAGQALARLVEREWPVEARLRSNGAVYRRWHVHGFRAARVAAAELQVRVDRGEPLPPAGRYRPRGVA